MTRQQKILTRSFAGGEMSPEMFGRMDDVQFQAGAETLLNMVPRPTGSAARRSGTQLVRQAKASGAAHLFPFVFSQTDALVVEAGRATVGGLDSGYFRLHSKGNTLLYSVASAFHESKIVIPRDLVHVTVTNGSPGVFTLAGHGLSVGQNVNIVATHMPGNSQSVVHGDPLVVNTVLSDDTFTLKTTGGTAVQITDPGFEVALRSFYLTRVGGNGNHNQSSDYWFSTHYNSGVSGHNLSLGDKVFLTAEPFTTSVVGFDGSFFKQLSGSLSGVAHRTNNGQADAPLGQQVLFFGGDLPPNIEPGRPYYIIKNDSTSDGDKTWRISETRGGAPHGSGGTGYTGSTFAGASSMCAMPLTSDTSEHWDVNRVYYVSDNGSEGFKFGAVQLAASRGQAESGNAIGIFTNAVGTGERRIHKVTSTGDIRSHQGKSYYCRKPLIDRSAYLTRLAHNQSNTRVPGVRTEADTAEYWREQSGKSTGGPFPVGITRTSGDLLQVDATAHGLENGQAIRMTQGFVGTGGVGVADTIDTGNTYFVVNKATDSFQLATSVGGSAIGLSLSFSFGGVKLKAGVVFDASTDRVSWPAHGLSDGDPVVFTQPEDPPIGGSWSVGLNGLSKDVTYYVKNKTTDDFQLSTSIYGDAVDITGTGNALAVVNAATYLEVPHDYTEAEIPEISTTQSNDVMTLCSPLRPAAELRRLGASTWDMSDIKFRAASLPPESLQATEVERGTQNRVLGVRFRQAPDATRSVHDKSSDEGGSDFQHVLELVFSGNGEDFGDQDAANSPNEGFFTEGDTVFLSGTEESGTIVTNTVSTGSAPIATAVPFLRIKEGYYQVVEELANNSARPQHAIKIANIDGSRIRSDQIITPSASVGSSPSFVPQMVHPVATNIVGVNFDFFETVGSMFGQVPLSVFPADATNDGRGSMLLVSPNAKVCIADAGEEIEKKYVVTSIDINNEESEASESLKVDNNLFVPGAFNKIGWSASIDATRYRVYKKLNGLYGFIGETDETTFKDDNIGPDLAVAPPIADTSLRKSNVVTFDADGDFVNWTDHGLENGMPVVFQTTDYLPGVDENRTYYVINKTDDTFQVSATESSETAVDFTGTNTGVHTAVSGLFPGATSYYEGRRVFAGSKKQPQDVFMTASGTEKDLSFSIPTVDSDRIYFRIAAREQSRVRHVVPIAQLMLLSDSTEYQVTPANDDILTPSSVSVRPQSFVGANFAQPALVNNTVVFAAARGGHVRELGYNASVLGYLTGDLSIRAAHLFDSFTIQDMAYQKAPLPIVWCVSSSGKLLGLTYVPEEKVGAWHQHTTTNGTFESVVCVPENDEDVVYVIVNRGGTRYVERLAETYRGGTESIADAFFVDSGITYNGSSTTTVAGLEHLNGQSVAYLADGLPGTGTVSGGSLTLSKAASKVHVGYPMTSQIKTLPMTMLNVDAFGSGRTKNVNRVWARLFESAAFEVGPSTSSLRTSRTPVAGELISEFVEVTMQPLWNDEGQIVIQQTKPLPLTVAGMTIEVATGG